MSVRYLQAIVDGVLLDPYGEVHRDLGGRTACRRIACAGKVAAVSHMQAVVYQLAPCLTCYPDPRSAGWRARRHPKREQQQ